MPRKAKSQQSPVSDGEARKQKNARANRGPTPGSQLDSGEGLPDGHVAKPADQHPDHEGATEDDIGDRTGPGAGYDQELPKTRRR
jgi:hypothetical protein